MALKLHPEVKEMVIWWEKRRLLFNAILIPFSIFLCYQFWDYPMRKIVGTTWIVLDTLVYFLFVNIAYSIPWCYSAIVFRKFKTRPLKAQHRWIVFGIGTFLAVILTDLFHVTQFDVLFAY